MFSFKAESKFIYFKNNPPKTIMPIGHEEDGYDQENNHRRLINGCLTSV